MRENWRWSQWHYCRRLGLVKVIEASETWMACGPFGRRGAAGAAAVVHGRQPGFQRRFGRSSQSLSGRAPHRSRPSKNLHLSLFPARAPYLLSFWHWSLLQRKLPHPTPPHPLRTSLTRFHVLLRLFFSFHFAVSVSDRVAVGSISAVGFTTAAPACGAASTDSRLVGFSFVVVEPFMIQVRLFFFQFIGAKIRFSFDRVDFYKKLLLTSPALGAFRGEHAMVVSSHKKCS